MMLDPPRHALGRKRRTRLVVAALVIGGLVAYNLTHTSGHRTRTRATASDHRAEPGAERQLSTPYPLARWRLASPGTLGRVTLWVSHILIRHDHVDRGAPFGPPGWNPLPPAPSRTREEALELARQLARDARARPEGFADLARRASEDVVTSAGGGSLGAIRAADLEATPTILDALAALQPGEVSEVVETRAGFHVLLRRPAPPLAQVAGRRIVIGYGDAPMVRGGVRRGHEPLSRTRAAAEAIARTIAAEIREGTGSFEALEERSSDFQDGTAHGDVGLRSTHEARPLGRAIEELSRLEVGEVSPPLDSPIGFQVYQRTEATPRPEYAMTTIRFRYASLAPDDDPHSRTKTRELAESAAQTLAREPERFAAFQAEYCCPDVVRWTEGQQPAALTEAVKALSPGGVAGTPVDVDSAFLIPRRVDLAEAPDPPAIMVDLPAPEAPDAMAFAKSVSGTAVQKLVLAVRDGAPQVLSLDEPRTREFRRIHDAVAALFVTKPIGPERDRALAALVLELQTLLSQDEYARYDAFLKDTVKRFLMRH